ncbi:MAG: hypothetical protein H6715_05945 [Myxococcales bacterium]|nr:hypothetical protein [Myxococcales bacterium]
MGLAAACSRPNLDGTALASNGLAMGTVSLATAYLRLDSRTGAACACNTRIFADEGGTDIEVHTLFPTFTPKAMLEQLASVFPLKKISPWLPHVHIIPRWHARQVCHGTPALHDAPFAVIRCACPPFVRELGWGGGGSSGALYGNGCHQL